MRLANLRGLALVAGLGLGANLSHAAVEAPPAKDAAPAAPTEDPAVSGLREHHRHHNSGGLMKFVAMSLDTLGTADDAKKAQIAKLQGTLDANMAPARDAEKELLGVLADGIVAGAVDTAKVDAALTKVKSAAAMRRDADYDTLNELHKVLSPEERAALVDKVEAHWEVWQKVNEGKSAGSSQLTDLADEVSLTPDQVSKITAALKAKPEAAPRDPKRSEARVRAFAAGFVTPSFDAKSLASKTPAVGGQGSIRTARFYEAVAPVLTAEQRTKVAENLHGDARYEPASSGK
jgi:Spy/CpxP family protein refolding chaperone